MWVRMRRWWWDRWMDSNQWTVRKTKGLGYPKRESGLPRSQREVATRERGAKKERVGGPRSREVREVKEKGQELQQRWAAVTLSLPSPFRAARGEVQWVCCAKNVAGAWRTIGKQRGPPGSTADQSSIVVVKNSVGSLCIFHFRGRRISRHLCHQTCLVLGGKSLYNRQHRSRRCPKPRASDCRALRRQQPRLFLLPFLSQSADGHIHLPLPLLSRRRTKNMFHFHARQTGSVLSTLPRDRSFPMQVAENSGVFGKTLRVRSSVVLAMAMTALNMEDGRRLAGTGLGPASSGERRTLMQERWKQSGQIGTEPQIRRPLFSSRACQALAHRLGFPVEIDYKFQCRPTQTNTT